MARNNENWTTSETPRGPTSDHRVDSLVYSRTALATINGSWIARMSEYLERPIAFETSDSNRYMKSQYVLVQRCRACRKHIVSILPEALEGEREFTAVATKLQNAYGLHVCPPVQGRGEIKDTEFDELLQALEADFTRLAARIDALRKL